MIIARLSCTRSEWDRGSEMKPDFALPLAEILARHKIAGANLEAVEVASRLRDPPDIFKLMLPKRRIHFDAECISDAGDLERVVGHFADATEGTWNLSELNARLNYDAEKAFIKAPSLAKVSAASRPIPPPVPVMMHTFSESLLAILHSSVSIRFVDYRCFELELRCIIT
jgi:hypothetical protein